MSVLLRSAVAPRPVQVLRAWPCASACTGPWLLMPVAARALATRAPEMTECARTRKLAVRLISKVHPDRFSPGTTEYATNLKSLQELNAFLDLTSGRGTGGGGPAQFSFHFFVRSGVAAGSLSLFAIVQP
jgi:hypothetical protein